MIETDLTIIASYRLLSYQAGSSPRVRAHTLPVNIFFSAVINVAYTRFKAGKDIMDTLVHLRKKKRSGGRGEATAGEPVLATPLWGILYADDAGVVSQSPEQLSKMMGVIVVVCLAFGLTVSKAKTEIMLTHGVMPESTAIFSVQAAGQVYNQPNDFVYLEGNVNQNAHLSIEVDRRKRNAWCNFRIYPLELVKFNHWLTSCKSAELASR